MADRRPDPAPSTRSQIRAEHIFDPGLASGQWELGNQESD
jgi:hypothetical protein